jgi:hypothetical protein
VSVLAIKADRLAQDIDTSAKLATELGLPTDVASALRASAKLQRTVLVIDQLDALADISDQQTQRLGVLLALVDEVVRGGSIPVIMSCRAFDFAHDVRLQRLDAEVAQLAPPTKEEVERVLKASGLEPLKLPERLRDLFASVHALDLFLQLKDVKGSTLMETHQQLLDMLWRQRLGAGAEAQQLDKAARAIAVMMSTREEIWLSRALLEEQGLGAAVTTLLERRLLIDEGKRVAFSHQTLFDFARAKAFVAEESLERYVRKKQDALFVRPVLWTGLAYLRDIDRPRYYEELESLCNDPKIRRHIQSLLVQFLGQVDDPELREVALMGKRINDPIWAAVAIDSVIGRAKWFEILRDTHLPPLLRAENAGMVSELLINAFRFAPDDVLTLMTKNWAQDKTKHRNVAWVLSYVEAWPDVAQSLALQVVSAGELEKHATELLVRNAIRLEPQFAPKLIAAELRRQLKVTNDDRDSFKALLEHASSIDYIVEAATEAPSAFVENVWPWFADVVSRLVRDGDTNRYGEDYSLATSLRFVARELPQALADALVAWAQQDFSSATSFIMKFAERDSVAIHRFIILTLEAALPDARTEAVAYLVGDARRLNVGDSSPSDGYSVRLIKALAPHLTAAEKQSFVAAVNRSQIVDRAELAEEKQDAADYWNERHRLRLLRALGLENVPAEVREQIKAAEERHPDADDDDDGIRGGVIGSPLNVADFLSMSDDEIIRAFDLLPDSTGNRHPDKDFTGGSVQLAHAFGEAAKKDPERFVRLLRRFRPGVTENPVESGLLAIAEVLPLTRIEEELLQLYELGFFHDQEYQHGAAYALKRASKGSEGISDRVCELLESWLTDGAPRDRTGERAARTESTDSILQHGDGGGSLPGGNYPALSALTVGYLSRNTPKLEAWTAVLERHLARPEDPRVWEAMGHDLGNVIYGDAARAVKFLDRLFERVPTIRDSHDGLIIIARAMHKLPPDAITRWLSDIERGPWPRRHQAVGELLVLFATKNGAPAWPTDRVNEALARFEQAKNDETRFVLGIAHSAARLWAEPDRRNAANRILLRVIPHSDDAMSKAVMSAFREHSMMADVETREMLLALTAMPSVVAKGHGFGFLENLRDLLPTYASEIADLLLVIVSHVGEQPQQGYLMSHGTELVDLALTLQRLPSPVRERGLDIFEELLSRRVYEARSVLAELDPAERREPIRAPRVARKPRRRFHPRRFG